MDIKPVVRAGDLSDETLYHGEHRHWLKVITDGLRRDDVEGRHAADA